MLLVRGSTATGTANAPASSASGAPTALAAVYAHFGLELTGPARAAMEALRAHSAPAAVGPAHRYALSDFGLTGDQVDGRFGSCQGV
jgi:hypothetical protein